MGVTKEFWRVVNLDKVWQKQRLPLFQGAYKLPLGDLQTDGQQGEMEGHHRAGLSTGAGLQSSNFEGTTGSGAVLKQGVHGKE